MANTGQPISRLTVSLSAGASMKDAFETKSVSKNAKVTPSNFCVCRSAVRDFQYLWSAQRTDIISKLGPVISREYLGSPYPLSAEVFEVGDTINAIGAFPV
jgi:hypothetical protein